MNVETLAQGFGILAAICGLWAMSQPSEKKLKVISLMHRFCYIVHFFLLGLDLAVIANLIGFVRIGISLYSRSWFWVFAVWGISIAAAGLSQPTSFVAVLPIMSSMILTLSFFRLTGAVFRIGLIAGSVLWVVHNIWAGSYGGVVLETGMIIFVLIGWYRAEKEKREKQSIKG